MTEKEIEMLVGDYCSFIGTWDDGEITRELVPFSGPGDFNENAIRFLKKGYRECLEINNTFPTYLTLEEMLFDDYSNKTYALSSLEIVKEYDCTTLTTAEVNELIESRAYETLDSDSYCGYLNYGHLITHYYDSDCEGLDIMVIDEFDMLEGLDRFYSNESAKNSVVNHFCDDESLNQMVIGDCQQILVPELLYEGTFKNSYGELSIATKRNYG